MRWVVLFGGIVVFAVVFYILLGMWLWRRAKALFGELEQATGRLTAAAEELDAAEVPPDRQRRERGSGVTRPRPAAHTDRRTVRASRAYDRARTAD